MFLVRKLKLNPIQAVNYTSNTKDTKVAFTQNETECIYDFPGVTFPDNETWYKAEEEPEEMVRFEGEPEEHVTENETDKNFWLKTNQEDGLNCLDTLMFSEETFNLNEKEENRLQETIIEINLDLSDYISENFQGIPKIK